MAKPKTKVLTLFQVSDKIISINLPDARACPEIQKNSINDKREFLCFEGIHSLRYVIAVNNCPVALNNTK